MGMEYRLCYVDPPWAFFTTLPVADQWGDDWDDAPYESNAGWPYPWTDGHGKPPYSIVRLAYDGDWLDTPDVGYRNSPWSVERINAGAVAWLSSARWADRKVVIPAGTTLSDFIRLIGDAGGHIWAPMDGLPVDSVRVLAKSDGSDSRSAA
jgi:hypothetical protein